MSTHQDINAFRAQRIANTHDPLTLMANTQTPFHLDHSSHITYIQHPQPNNNFVQQPSFSTNFMQHPMQNLRDISNPTTAFDMALALKAKTFTLNDTTPINNQKSSSNPSSMQIAQPGMNMDQDRQMLMVEDNVGNQFRLNAMQNVGNQVVLNASQNPGVQNVGNQIGLSVVSEIANQYGNGNVVTTPAEGNGNGINGNPIRWYNCRGEGHYGSNCTVKPQKRDAAYLQTQLLIAQKEEAGIQLNSKEFDFMAAAGAYDEIEKVIANCNLQDNLQQASKLGTQSDKAPFYDSDGSTEEEQYTELLEPIPEPHQVPQNDSNVISEMVGANGGNQFRQYAGQNVGYQNGYNAVQNVGNQVVQDAVQNQGVQNIGNQNGQIGVQNIGNGNVVAARAEGNAPGNNGNQIRCYNCRGLGHLARNCTVRPRRRDAAYLQTQLLIAQKEEAGIQLQAEEFDLMAAAADLDEIEEVNANCILMANLQQASTSGTQTDNAPVYDSDGSAEVHNYDNCYDNEIFNMFTQEEQYTELLEPIPEPHQEQQNDSNVISDFSSVEQEGGTVDQHPATVEETRAYFESLYNNLALEVEKVNSVNQKMKETNADLTTELARYKNQEKCFEISQEKYDKLEICYQKSVYQEQCLTKKDKCTSLKFRVQNFEIQFLKEAAKFVRDFKSLAKEADESLAKHKALELEIERLLRAVITYNDMQQKIERLQAQLGDQKGKSKDTPCVSDTLDPLSQKLEKENVGLEFQVLNYAKENAHLKTTYKNLFDSIKVTCAQTKAIIDSLQDKLHDTIYENAKLRAQLFDKDPEQKDTNKGTSMNTQFSKQSILGKPHSSSKPKLFSVSPFPKSMVIPKVGKSNALSKPVTSNSAPSSRESNL
ncbi:retrovirus-related pol polyprotein from transposon TNT 1-94 [Tanacetum coccineum]